MPEEIRRAEDPVTGQPIPVGTGGNDEIKRAEDPVTGTSLPTDAPQHQDWYESRQVKSLLGALLVWVCAAVFKRDVSVADASDFINTAIVVALALSQVYYRMKSVKKISGNIMPPDFATFLRGLLSWKP
jgi:hypothetical protein